jgi:hypothetical protein
LVESQDVPLPGLVIQPEKLNRSGRIGHDNPLVEVGGDHQ